MELKEERGSERGMRTRGERGEMEDSLVGSDPDDLVVGKSGKSDGSGSVGDLKRKEGKRRSATEGEERNERFQRNRAHEVKEGSSEGNDGSVSVKTVHDSTHG